ncbi:receptor like protein 6 [Raphanus sativus]|nr:receptor like protein 6 [Raphanus sativus]
MIMLDLNSNAFQGPLVIPPVTTEAMLVSKNSFTGKIPRSICGHRFLNILDLSNTNFTGSIPRCLRNLNGYLSVLNLRYNQLSGNIPEIFTNATTLTSLDLGHNRFVGTLPRSLKGCSVLEVLNVGGNNIEDTFPFWLSSLPKLKVMVLRDNRFKGLLYHPRHYFGYPSLQIIDIANNHFTGNLPSDYFAEWNMTTSKYFKGFHYIGDSGSYYHDSMVLMSKGVEMKLERIFTLLTAIDFSGNKLQGKIPESFRTTSSWVRYRKARSFKRNLLHLLKETLDYVVLLSVKNAEMTWKKSNHKN